MADFIPVKALFSGLDVIALGEFNPGDTIALALISGFPAGVTLELGNNSIDTLGDVSVPTPANNEVLTFNSTSGNWEAVAPTGSTAAIWGNITGTLSDQLDLQSALNAKADQIDLDNHTTNLGIHFTEGSIDHVNIQSIGTNTHAQIDAHITDTTLHFTEGSISHLTILDTGVNTHAQIDAHIGDTTVHFSTLDGLSDVIVPTPTLNDVLTFDGTNWISQAPTGGGGVVWGTITGTLSDQTDLQAALDTKVESASNVGTGDGVFAQKVITDLEFKTLVAGDGIVITPSATELLIDNRREAFFAHNGSTVQTFGGTLITVLFPTIVRNDVPYVYANGEITINNTGWYLISYDVSADNTGSSRGSSRSGITVNSTTVQLPGSFSWGYHRNSSAGEATLTGRVLVNLTAGDIVRVMIQQIAGNNALTTLAEGCRITIVGTGAP